MEVSTSSPPPHMDRHIFVDAIASTASQHSTHGYTLVLSFACQIDQLMERVKICDKQAQ